MKCLALAVVCCWSSIAAADSPAEYAERRALDAVGDGSAKSLAGLAGYLRSLKP